MNSRMFRVMIAVFMVATFLGPRAATSAPAALSSPVAYAQMLDRSTKLLAMAQEERKATQAFGADEVLGSAKRLHETVVRIQRVQNAKWDEFMGEAIMAALDMEDLRNRADALDAVLEDRPDFVETRTLWRAGAKAVSALNVAVATATAQPGTRVFVPGRDRDAKAKKVFQMGIGLVREGGVLRWRDGSGKRR